MEIRLIELAKKINAQLHGDGNIVITGVASIKNAQKGHITFLKDNRFRRKLISCCASAVVLSESNLIFCKIPALVVTDPNLAYFKLVKLINNNFSFTLSRIISPKAHISSNVILGKRIGIGANAVIESGVILNDDVIIGSGSYIGRNVKIGTGTCILENVTICNKVEIGKYCIIKSGSVIGSDGFGYINNNSKWIKIPQLGIVQIGNHVEIGACTTIDRGALDNTCIANGVIIDNQCHIAHNVIIESDTAIAGGVIIAGSSVIGKSCMIGGASVINGHINICDKVTITGMSMVTKSITKSGIYSSGIPVQLNKIWRKTAVLVMHIDSILKRIKFIEKKLKNYSL